MSRVFISYSRKDLPFVQRLAADLQAAGLEPWYDISDLSAGTRWGQEIQSAIRQSQFFLVVLTPASISSEWVEKEFLFARSQHLKIVPVLRSACDLPMWFINLHFIDLQKKNYSLHFKELLKALEVTPGVEAVPLEPAPSLPAKAPLKEYHKKPKHNLPLQLTSFIGREKELDEVKHLLSDNRLVTITGPGGTGKTRLALKVAEALVEVYPNGTWLVELAPLADPNLLAQVVASSLGAHQQQGRPVQETLTDYLREKKLLLLLDNCEHLVEACARLADTLLHACPGLKILASSREALGIGGEVSYRLPSLSTPDIRQLPEMDKLGEYESIRLFLDRAAAALPGFTLTDVNASLIAGICSRLDGIPLAIELAAARVRMLSVEQIAARLDDRFRLLTGGSRAALPRLQTLHALIDWSYNLLSPDEKTLFQRLSVFAGGWSLEAAEAVCRNDNEDFDVLENLSQLVNKSLVQVDCENGNATRYRMLETIRQFASEKLVESGAGASTRTRHLKFFLELAEEARKYYTRIEQMDWLSLLKREHDNLRAAFEWVMGSQSTDPSMPPEAGLRLASSLYRLWTVEGFFQEGKEWLSKALAGSDPSIHTVARARTLIVSTMFAEDNFSEQLRLLDQGITLFRELEDKAGLAFALHLKTEAYLFNGDELPTDIVNGILEESLMLYRELADAWGIACVFYNRGFLAWNIDSDLALARDFFLQSLKLYRQAGDRRGIAMTLMHLGLISMDYGNYAEARRMMEEGISYSHEWGDSYGLSQGIANLGVLALAQGDFPTAVASLEEALSNARDSGNKVTVAGSLFYLGRTFRYQNDFKRASEVYIESLKYFRSMGDKYDIFLVLVFLGELARLQGDIVSACDYFTEALANEINVINRDGMVFLMEESATLIASQGRGKSAAVLFGAATALRTTINKVPWPVERIVIDENISLVRAQLDEAIYDKACAEGQKMSYEQAVEYLHEQLNTPAPPSVK